MTEYDLTYNSQIYRLFEKKMPLAHSPRYLMALCDAALTGASATTWRQALRPGRPYAATLATKANASRAPRSQWLTVRRVGGRWGMGFGMPCYERCISSDAAAIAKTP